MATVAAIKTQPLSTTASPKDSNRILATNEEIAKKEASSEKQLSPARSETTASATKTDGATKEDTKSNTNAIQPLAPPPKPSQQQGNPSDADYFGGGHGNTHFSLERNPFEQSFGNPSTETPGRFIGLPSVSSLTSPTPLGASGTPGWQLGNSLRSGPLSPAMLPGPTNQPGYFDEQFRQSFPTPNESSLRTGLTPGGGGSMFPAPSPNSQAIFNSMTSGLATPGTLDFQRSAMNAAARQKDAQSMGPTPQGINKQDYQPAQQIAMGRQDPFNTHPDHDAVNTLLMFGQTGNRNTNQFAVPQQPQPINGGPRNGGQTHQDTSPTAARGGRPSIGSIEGMSESGEYGSDGSRDAKPASKSAKAKKGAVAKATNGRRKADDTSKGSAAKRVKANSGLGMDMMDDDDDSDDGIKNEDDMPDHHPNGKKMTDEEKRKNFLERNRVAALKCRQRKKQWLANLQAKVEIFTSENDALNQTCNALREEVISLKTMLAQHKSCEVSVRQGLSGDQLLAMLGEGFNPNSSQYSMMGQNGQMNGGMMMHQGMQRR